MDKNQTVGITLISLLLLAYLAYFSIYPPAPEVNTKQINDSIAQIQKQAQVEAQAAVQQLPDSVLKQQKGVWAAGLKGEEKEVIVENQDLKVTLSSKGGKIVAVQLKNYKTFDKQPLFLVTPKGSEQKLEIGTNVGNLDLYNLYYTVTQNTPQSVTFKMQVADNQFVEQTYSLEPQGFTLAYQLNTQGMDSHITNKVATFSWQNELQRNEKNIELSRTQSTVNFFTQDGDLEAISEAEQDFEELKAETPVRWVAHKEKFFTAGILTNKVFNNLYTSTEVPKETQLKKVKTLYMSMQMPLTDLANNAAGIRFAFVPNDYDVAKAIAEGYQKNVYLGWAIFAPINIYLIRPVFQFFESITSNYGIVIFLLVLAIKLALFPLVYKSYISMAKTRVLKPEIDEIKERVGDDMLALQQEQMALYQKVGVNPLSGCIPVLAQMPILLAMFNFFPNLIDLRQKGFLWADDLSSYDTIVNLPFTIPFYGDHVSLFTILMTISTLVYTYYNNQMTMSSASNNPQQSMMVFMSYTMPLIFFFVLNSFSSGLTYYYFLSNVITIVQQLAIRSFVDDKKIRAILEENKKKNANNPQKKGGGFQSRLQDMMKAQAELAKQQQDQNKKK